MQDMMIDLETLGTRPDAAILSIGACMFDRKRGVLGRTFYVRCAPDLSEYSVDYNTFKFWMEQSEPARAALFYCAVPLYKAAREFIAFWAVAASEKTRVWALPAAFDIPIMENMLRKELKMSPPWHYSAPRCCRTLFDVFNIKKEDRIKPEVEHDALSDAKAQAETAIKAYSHIPIAFR